MSHRSSQACLLALLGGLALQTSACINIRPVVVSPKTQLENDIIGTFERLRSELTLASTASQPATRKLSPAELRVLQALLDRQYNAAEVDALKGKRVLLEQRTGLLQLDAQAAQQQGVTSTEAQRLLLRENAARQLIMNGLIELSPKLSKKDLPQIQAFFYRLHGG